MSLPNPPNTVDNGNNSLQDSNKSIMDIINQQQNIDRVKALMEILKVYDIDITITGDKYTIQNIELLTEYSNKKMTEWMVKLETYRMTMRDVLHLSSIDEEKLIGYMLAQVKLKMISHRRKRVTEYINGMKNDIATAELIPQNTKKKKFFGMG